jgi:hypothetical protein
MFSYCKSYTIFAMHIDDCCRNWSVLRRQPQSWSCQLALQSEY